MSNSSSVNDSEKIDEINRFIKSFNAKILFPEIFIALFGVLGNILVLIVINRRTLKNTSSSVFITYLAIFDISVLLSHGISLARFSENAVFECSLNFFTDLSTFCANWVLVIITIERCIVVYLPFYAKRLCTLNNATNFLFYCFAGHRFRQATVQTYYDYSALSKTFYHHYILRNKEYDYPRTYDHALSHLARTPLTNRSSTSPHYPRSPYRTSAL
ncbi:unnamed protein product [Rotaria magnacalcarata]